MVNGISRSTQHLKAVNINRNWKEQCHKMDLCDSEHPGGGRNGISRSGSHSLFLSEILAELCFASWSFDFHARLTVSRENVCDVKPWNVIQSLREKVCTITFLWQNTYSRTFEDFSGLLNECMIGKCVQQPYIRMIVT